jgi:hypothetical protein
MYGIGLAVWCVVAIVLAWALSRLNPSGWMRRIAFLVLVPVVLVLPAFDELVGKYQFDRLCRDAEAVIVYGTIPVREPFYTSDGKWRRSGFGRSLERDEVNRIEQAYLGLVRHEITPPVEVSAVIPIYQHEWRIINRESGALLVSVRQLETRGGWLSRKFEAPAFVRAQCPSPAFFEALDQRILPFDQQAEDKK